MNTFRVQFIDIHSHIQFPEYDTDRESIIDDMKEKGIATIVIGTDIASSQKAVALADAHDNVYACIGIHPADGAHERNETMSHPDIIAQFESLIIHPKVIAVGECGLDHGKQNDRPQTDCDMQRADFDAHICLALKHDKPLMIHSRNSLDDIYEFLVEAQARYASQYPDIDKRLRGNIHFFTGTKEQALKFTALGFTLSFTGVITFTNDYNDALRSVPLSMIHAETDSPYVSPVPYRGIRNDPTKVHLVVEALAKARGESLEVVKNALVENARRIFGLN